MAEQPKRTPSPSAQRAAYEIHHRDLEARDLAGDPDAKRAAVSYLAEIIERHRRNPNQTGEELAQEAGLRAFDFGMPLDWFTEACKLAGFNLSGHVVWCYDTEPTDEKPEGVGIFGYPVAITPKGREALGRMAARLRQ